MPAEPISIALLLAAAGLLLVVSTLFSQASDRIGVPFMLVFLAIGMLAGSEGLGRIPFEDYHFAFRAGTAALALILFDGGLNTPKQVFRETWRPATVLATVGVAGTAVLVAVAGRALGLPWSVALLLGAIVSSTDAAAVFAALRGSGLNLRRRVGATLELESGLNDPVAIILTIALTGSLAAGEPPGWGLLAALVVQLAVGAALGVGLGYGGRLLLQRVRLPAGGLYPVLTIAITCLAFGLPTLLFGSGFLAVYLAGMVLGNSAIPYKPGLLRVHDALAWFSQVVMFVMLGLLSFPSRLIEAAPIGIYIGLFLACVGRPVIVLLCLAPFRYRFTEAAYVGLVGLRGAVPIILATFPVLAGAPGAHRIFDIVFFVVVVSAVAPGGIVPWLTRRFGLATAQAPRPHAILELHSSAPLDGDILSFYVEPAAAVLGSRIADLPFPAGSAAMLVVRGRELIAPRGATVLQDGDHVFVFCRREDRAMLQLLFGRIEEVGGGGGDTADQSL